MIIFHLASQEEYFFSIARFALYGLIHCSRSIYILYKQFHVSFLFRTNLVSVRFFLDVSAIFIIRSICFQRNRHITCQHVLFRIRTVFSLIVRIIDNCILQESRLLIRIGQLFVFCHRHHLIRCIGNRCTCLVLIDSGFTLFLYQLISRHRFIGHHISYSHHSLKYRIFGDGLHHHIPVRFFYAKCLLAEFLIVGVVCRRINGCNHLILIPDAVQVRSIFLIISDLFDAVISLIFLYHTFYSTAGLFSCNFSVHLSAYISV